MNNFESTMQQHLLNISQRLSVNTDMGDGSITGDELLLKKQYEEYHEPVVKTFSKATESPFFKLLLEHLKEGLGKLPGWSGWILLEYYDDAVNGLRLVLITDENGNSIKADDIRGLDQENYNFSLLIRAMREFHVHVNGWHFKTTKCDPIYHCENKLSLNIMLPGKSNPYSEKLEQDQHYNAYARPILISQAEKESETISHITQNDDQFIFNSDLGDYFQMIEQCRRNADAFTNENNQNNQLLNDHQIARGLMEEFDCQYLERIAGKTPEFIIKDLNQKLDRNIEKILIDKGKIKTLTRKSFEEYCQRLAKCFTDSNQFLYLPAFTTLKKGEDKLPQRKDLMIGSILIGVDEDNSFNTDQIHHLWRFVQSELLKWYNQYNSFKLYTSNKRMKQEALLNAITQVFARNESHINGSHVIAHYLKNKEEFANQEKKYLEYLQQRMELVASVQQYPGFLKGYYDQGEICTEFFEENVILNKGIADGVAIGMSALEGIYPNKITVALPGHNLGKQLIMVFLEGMFRNCKKHGKIDSTIQLNYNISEPNEDTLKEKYYVLDVWDKLDGSNVNLEKINQLLTQPVLKDNRLRPGSWGMLELKAAAAILIDFPLIYIDSLNDDASNKKKDGAYPETLVVHGKTYPVFIRAYLYNDDGTIVENNDASPKHLGYRLYLLKPKVLFTNNKDFYDKASESNKELLIYKPKFSPTEACDFFLSDNSEKTPHNYREISLNGFNAGSDSIEIELWKEYAAQRKWNENEMLFISCDKQGNIYKINGKPDQKVTEFHNKIIFDNHGIWYRKLHENEKNKLNCKAYYCLFGLNNDGLRSFYFDNDAWRYKYLEMANTKVSIIDERVQKSIWEAKNDNNSGMNIMEAYRRMDILIPDKENGLDLDKYDSDKVHEYLKDRLNECRYTILHHGIFEALCKSIHTDKYDQDTINYFYSELHKPADGQFLVLMSGSGVPSSLPNIGYFLNLSTLQIVLEKRSKLHLVQLLHSLRPMK